MSTPGVTASGQVPGWIYVAITLLGTVYGQIVIKWQVSQAGQLPAGGGDKAVFLLKLMFLNPWVMSGLLAALIGALSWMAALTVFDLSTAYPWMGLSFLLIGLFSYLLFNEPFSTAKVLGLVLVVLGLVIGGGR